MRINLGLLVLTLASAPAWAIQPGPSSAPQQGTEQWLQLQSSGQVASRNPQATTAMEHEAAMRRWLESYTLKIPQWYRDDDSGKIGK
ncbi:DUF3613 domain-containing protein [Pseudomonas sp. RIT-To-2]|jgi:aminoglycoside phosphotransferase|uniref:DUF3613 domain-containing protein n=1 Tax=Pseudomonas sp. RIT-To-2 TaxID=3462541 RepID=UPI002412F302